MTADRGRSAVEALKGEPTCLSPFVYETSYDSAAPVPIFVDYRIRCRACSGDGFQILSRPVVVPAPSPYYGLEPGDTLLRPPHELRCVDCGREDVVFDPRRHGYDGTDSHGSSYECSDAKGEPSAVTYRVTVSLGFNIDWEELEELAEDAGVSPCDLFDVLCLRGEPIDGGEPLELDYECA